MENTEEAFKFRDNFLLLRDRQPDPLLYRGDVVLKDVTAAGPLIATIRVNYKDGSTDTIYKDTTWKILSSVPPAGWTSPSFDDSKWGTPVVKLAGTQTPWGRPWAYPPAIDMDPAQTIWTDEVKNGVAPVGHRAFRTTITSPYGKAAVCGKMVIDADNNYTLYVNGDYLGHGGDWHTMQAYSVPILDPDVNVIAVDGENGAVSPGSTQPNAAAVVAALVIAYNDGSFATFYTSKNWKAVHSVPSGFEEKDYDDGSWMAASEYGQAEPNIASLNGTSVLGFAVALVLFLVFLWFYLSPLFRKPQPKPTYSKYLPPYTPPSIYDHAAYKSPIASPPLSCSPPSSKYYLPTMRYSPAPHSVFLQHSHDAHVPSRASVYSDGYPVGLGINWRFTRAC
ncbi:hypothetical protein EV421DRAFT_1898291 [Armillaria borealis]|uniref:Uncharacterized protein n=1 Tax=Armillaria borealis TaxID=47425 RepID=A0AA39N065_9AGAR|nr:hypothetical protein EV421DRAFT_1898291 [Armillaria borealis]